MKEEHNRRFEVEPVLRSTLPDVAVFLHRWQNSEFEGSPVQLSDRETVGNIERRLGWLLTDNPLAMMESTLGYCLRDSGGVIRGIDLCFPVAFLSSDKRLLGLCSGTFLVEPAARSMGFYLFKRCLSTPGYAFQFASTCNTYSSELWRSIGGYPVPNSQTEYLFPIRLDMLVAGYVAYRTSSQVAARLARMCGRGANPILRFLARPSSKFVIEPSQDWEKLAELSRRHRSPDYITSDRSPAFLRWRYGRGSPSHPCGVYVFRDERGNEGWFALSHLTRGKRWQFRTAVLLDAIWPREQINYTNILGEILRVTAATSDAISFRWQPGIDHGEFNRCVIARKFAAPRAFVTAPKGTPRFPLESLDYDNSDYIAWAFHWTDS
jgi:hypothetical protein